VIAAVLALEYHAIVRWEEQLLAARLGGDYDEYRRAVPRWIPRVRLKSDTAKIIDVGSGRVRLQPDRWSATLFSERGTLLAIAAGLLLLWLKARS
jgi:hypothetical protein